MELREISHLSSTSFSVILNEIKQKLFGLFDNKKETSMALRVGQYAPDFCLEDQQGRKIRLSDFLGRKNVVLAFFPLAWTPI